LKDSLTYHPIPFHLFFIVSIKIIPFILDGLLRAYSVARIFLLSRISRWRGNECHSQSHAPHLRAFISFIMQTCNSNSPPQPPGPLPSLPETTPKAHWSEADEIALIDYITKHKAKAGDGMKFKSSFWTDVAKEMLAHTTSGGPKTIAGCSAK